MPSKRASRRNRKLNRQTPNPSRTTVAMPMPVHTNRATDYIRRQYNVLHKIEIIGGSGSAARTVSLIGAKDSGVDGRCITIHEANNNDALKNDMSRN